VLLATLDRQQGSYIDLHDLHRQAPVQPWPLHSAIGEVSRN
jgi:hypothetical protein